MLTIHQGTLSVKQKNAIDKKTQIIREQSRQKNSEQVYKRILMYKIGLYINFKYLMTFTDVIVSFSHDVLQCPHPSLFLRKTGRK